MRDEDDDEAWTQLFVARWPDGRTVLLSASCMEEVAELLDELGDPGACEVTPYHGAVCINISPAPNLDDDTYLELSEGTFEEPDARLELMSVAYPVLHEAIVAAMEKDEPDFPYLTSEQWTTALEKENARELRPSTAWTEAIAAWWKAFSGADVDKSAALRQTLNVTIPGQPEPETPEQQAMFDAENRRAMDRVVAAIGFPKESGQEGVPTPTATATRRKKETKTRKPSSPSRGPKNRR